MERKVYIVHCVDTEGPLSESLEATFTRVKEIFGIELFPSQQNLKKLQRMEINLGGKEIAIANLVAPERLNMKGNWEQLDEMLEEVFSHEFRNLLPDSEAKGWICNWFCMDHVGFSGCNPRHRDAGYHNIFDHYFEYLCRFPALHDSIQWHFHPIPFSGDFNGYGTAYCNSKTIYEIICRKIIDRKWFPTVYRPGFHTERPDSNWFLEQWIPFDYANQSTKGRTTNQPDLVGARYGDWRRAPSEWTVYHPSHDDYQIPGNCRRWIARCLNMEARLREITINDFREGFLRAQNGQPTIISFTNHDFRDMRPEINKIRSMLQQTAKEFPDVSFVYSTALEAMRKVLNLSPKMVGLSLKLQKNSQIMGTGKLEIRTQKGIFGPQPFLAIKTISGQYIWDNLDFEDQNFWSYTLDQYTFKLNALEKIGVAANSPDGVTEIAIYDIITNEIEYVFHNLPQK